MNPAVKTAAEVHHVRDVSLLGTADAAYWEDQLKDEDLVLARKDGQAQVLIVAADLRFMRIRFRELSFSILAFPPEGGPRGDGAYLARAFNSSRLFAFCERVFFSTPYDHGNTQVTASVPASMQLILGGQIVFQASMGADGSPGGREPSSRGPGGWEGPIFLPTIGRRKDDGGYGFFGSMRGQTGTYPFLEPRDTVTITPSLDRGILRALLESGFVGKEWSLREDATHVKSKTYKRSEIVALLGAG